MRFGKILFKLLQLPINIIKLVSPYGTCQGEKENKYSDKNNYFQTQGVTAATVLNKDRSKLKVAFAFCDPKDNFCKLEGKYEALKQAKPVKVYRDANRDMNYDETKIAEGVFGINIHKAGADSTYVENWSEGCQVFKKAADFESFMTICRKAAAIHGKSFTYTLIESADIK